jgi:hypothetical protein
MNTRSKKAWQSIAEVALALAVAALLVTTLLPAIISSLLD